MRGFESSMTTIRVFKSVRSSCIRKQDVSYCKLTELRFKRLPQTSQDNKEEISIGGRQFIL